RFHARDVGAARHARRPRASRADDSAARARRRPRRARAVNRSPAEEALSPDMSHYQKPPELYDGLRLHQNENTGGCSPHVLDALATLRADQIGFSPPYA